MKKIIVKQTNNFNINESYEADPIEIKIEKMIAQEEPIDASMAYVGTERKEGVKPEHDIRTNRFELAHEIMAKGATSHDKGRDFRRQEAGKTEENPVNGDISATSENQ